MSQSFSIQAASFLASLLPSPHPSEAHTSFACGGVRLGRGEGGRLRAPHQLPPSFMCAIHFIIKSREGGKWENLFHERDGALI